MALLTTPRHYEMLLNAIVAAGVFRVGVAIVAYIVARDLPWDQVPDCMTTHDDSPLFVTAFVILVVKALEYPDTAARRLAWLLGPALLLAIQLNNRRVAWASLGAALIIVYTSIPPSSTKRRLNRIVARLLPVLALYTAVGWGRHERIFKPLESFSSLHSADNPSNRSRDNENDGLVFTFAQNGSLGTGFGHQYIETDSSLSAVGFTQYRYIPHDSVLALLAFTGVLGLIGILMPIPISVFLNARTYRATAMPAVRAASLVGVAEVAICMNQMYGDMGFVSSTTLGILATAIATAGRLSAWRDTSSGHGKPQATVRVKGRPALRA
jgi:hypothetical protein